MANHQIGLESPLFMALCYALSKKPVEAVAKPDHFNAWLEFLLNFATESLGSDHPYHLLFFDKNNPLEIINHLKKPGSVSKSLLVHAEGTRSKSAGALVTKLSSIFIDAAIAQNIPIVPVRFVGGLPNDEVEANLDFPYNNGRQDFMIGTPILAQDLKKLPYAQRPKAIIDEINLLGPKSKQEDVLINPDAEFVEQTQFFKTMLKMPNMQAMLFSMLTLIQEPCEQTASLINAVKTGNLLKAQQQMPSILLKFLAHLKNK